MVASCERSATESNYVSEYEPSDDPIAIGSATIWDDYYAGTTKNDGTTTDDEATDDEATDDEDSSTSGYFTTGETFGMYAFYLPYDSSKSEAVWIPYLRPDFMNNQEFTLQSDGTWSYSPTKYWPNNTNDKIFFWGYASHGADDLEFTSIDYDENGGPVIKFTSPSNMAYSRDFVTGTKLTGKTDMVSLYLERQLCRVRFEMCNGVTADKYTVRVDELRVSGVTTTSAFHLNEDTGKVEPYTAMHGTGQVVGDCSTIIPYDNDAGDQTFLLSEYGDRFIEYGIVDGQYVYYPIVTEDRYWFLDPYIKKSVDEEGDTIYQQQVILTLDVGLYTSDPDYVDRKLLSSEEITVDATIIFDEMEVNNTYTVRLKYTPIIVTDPVTGEEVESSGLFVYCVEEWEEIVMTENI